MDIEKKLKTHLEEIVAVARFSPSVHNSQPWKIKLEGRSLLINIDDANALKYGDPTGRETYISLGVFAESIILASEKFELYHVRISLLKHGAEIVFSDKGVKRDTNMINLLPKRCTDRSIYKTTDVPITFRNQLEKIHKNKNISIWYRDDRDFIDLTADLTASGISIALSSPDFRSELSKYLIYPWGKVKRGISVLSLRIPFILALFEKYFIKLGFGLKSEAKLERYRWLSASAVILITSKGDLHEDWFECGRAYINISLLIESFNLSQATSAAIVEASTFHLDIETMLGTKDRLQSVIRIGKGKSKKIFSPRIDIASIITSN